MGVGAPAAFVDRLLGGERRMLQHDLPELPELDNLFAPEGAILRAQTLAAAAFGARRTWFLVNGTTGGVLGALLACVQLARASSAKRACVVLPRNAHKSAVHALVLCGATPVWVVPELDAASGLPLGLSARAVERAIAAAPGHVAAVLVVSPTYHGVVSDIRAVADVCRAAHAPLVVDEVRRPARLRATPLRHAPPSGPSGARRAPAISRRAGPRRERRRRRAVHAGRRDQRRRRPRGAGDAFNSARHRPSI